MRADRQTDRQTDKNAIRNTSPWYQEQSKNCEFDIAVHKAQAVYTYTL